MAAAGGQRARAAAAAGLHLLARRRRGRPGVRPPGPQRADRSAPGRPRGGVPAGRFGARRAGGAALRGAGRLAARRAGHGRHPGRHRAGLGVRPQRGAAADGDAAGGALRDAGVAWAGAAGRDEPPLERPAAPAAAARLHRRHRDRRLACGGGHHHAAPRARRRAPRHLPHRLLAAGRAGRRIVRRRPVRDGGRLRAAPHAAVRAFALPARPRAEGGNVPAPGVAVSAADGHYGRGLEALCRAATAVRVR